MASSAPSPRLVVVGGGHAALPLVQRAGDWVRRGVAVTLLDEHPTLFYSGMVPEYLGGVYAAAEVQIDLGALCAAAGVRFRQERVTAVLPEGGVETASGETVACDLAVFDVGAVNPGRVRAGDAVPTKPLHHVEALERFVAAALGGSGAARHLAVVGGGAAGVEVALNLSARALAARPGALRLTVLEPSGALLPGFPSGMQDDVQRRLEARGVAVRLRSRVARVEAGAVRLAGGAALPADRVLWATGSAAPPLFAEAGLPTDERGFLRVADTLQVPAAPWLFAAGDCAALAGYPALERIGVHAVKQGPTLRANVGRALGALRAGRGLAGLDLAAFRPYPVAPLILSTGEPVGLGVAGGLWVRGGPVLRLKHFVDRRWMRHYSARWQRSPGRMLGREAAVSERTLPVS